MSVLLKLFHGRKDPDAKLYDWGDEGPIFGPCKWVHTTYSTDVKFEHVGGGDAATLHVVDDMLYYDGIWYGAWSVFDTASDDAKGITIVPFDRERSFPPGTARIARESGDQLIAYPPVAWGRDDYAAETYRREESIKRARDLGIKLCLSCSAAEGHEQFDNGLACGVHCGPCFEQMVHDSRQRSW